MLIYTMLGNNQLKTKHIGTGRIPNPAKVNYIEADCREAEVIIKTAPYLNQDQAKSLKVWTEAEAIAAALAFNYTEKSA